MFDLPPGHCLRVVGGAGDSGGATTRPLPEQDSEVAATVVDVVAVAMTRLQPADIACGAVFLRSPAHCVTGTVLAVDGGLRAGKCPLRNLNRP